jgi:hypothetical protein
MATPQVAGAASRVWSTMPASTAAQVRVQILLTGRNTVLDNAGLYISTDPTLSDNYLCWPASMNVNAFDVNVAAAMGRTAIFSTVRDANGSLPIPGAKMTVYQGTAVKGYGGIADAPFPDGGLRVLNVPMAPFSPYTLGVTAAGYATGVQKYMQYTASDCGGGHNTAFCVFGGAKGLTLPKNVPGVLNIVTDWRTPFYDIDQYLFTPSSAPVACAVGAYAYLFTGNDCGVGSLTQAPFARLLNNGGYYSSGYSYYATSTWTALKPPLYPTTSGTPYEIFLADGQFGNHLHNAFGAATMRLWSAGAIKATMVPSATSATFNCTIGTDCNGFWVGSLSGTGAFTPGGLYGIMNSTPTGILPYGKPGTMRSFGARASPRNQPAAKEP